jgi:hypothetical protein
MARPQVGDGGDGFQIWRVAANILNKQLRSADKRWSSRLRVVRGANNSSPYKNKLVTRIHKKPWTLLTVLGVRNAVWMFCRCNASVWNYKSLPEHVSNGFIVASNSYLFFNSCWIQMWLAVFVSWKVIQFCQVLRHRLPPNRNWKL